MVPVCYTSFKISPQDRDKMIVSIHGPYSTIEYSPVSAVCPRATTTSSEVEFSEFT